MIKRHVIGTVYGVKKKKKEKVLQLVLGVSRGV